MNFLTGKISQPYETDFSGLYKWIFILFYRYCNGNPKYRSFHHPQLQHLLPLNIFSTYYFQALLKPQSAFLVSVGRGIVLSGLFIFLLPIVCQANSLWFAMPITELIIAVYVVWKMRKYTKELWEV